MNSSAPLTADHGLTWNVEQLYHQLAPRLPNLSIEVVSEIASTNSALLERARVASRLSFEGDRAQVRRSTESQAFGRRTADHQPCLLVAEHQTQGRGRHGRVWQSEAVASLTFSLAMPLSPVDWSGFSLAVGVALADALDPAGYASAGQNTESSNAPWIGLKWPNDLWLMPAGGSSAEGRKLGGLLIETVPAGDMRLAVVGIGLNVLPLSLAHAQASSGYACLQEIDPDTSAPQVLARIVLPLVDALQRFEREGFAGFADRFAARDVLRGRAVHAGASGAVGSEALVRTSSSIEGIAEGVSGTGALRVRVPGDGLREVMSGEVSVRLRPTPAAGAC
ncbi:MAG: biotin--[acetyl-CoA-carboxylase] ligase [Burkholderiaceae bacterium]|nr:biotin--[acetyl-CoA-carboxylase] ligase [Burkholderiaceae bacterium]